MNIPIHLYIQLQNMHTNNSKETLDPYQLTLGQSKPQMNTDSIDQQVKQKCDMATITDQIICKCQCDQISKLKQKAHKSFMQVIQIQNLYKQEIQQLREQYQERQKTQLKKFLCKETMLNQKCKEIQQELDRERLYAEKQRQERICKCKMLENHLLQLSMESPFTIDNIDEILPEIRQNRTGYNHDDSTDTIRHLKQFIPSQNLQIQLQLLTNNIHQSLTQIKSSSSKSQNNKNNNNNKNPQYKYPQTIQLFENTLEQMILLMKNLIKNIIDAQEKYNRLQLFSGQLQKKNGKLIGSYQAAQKQTKFMAEHIRRLSQDKIKIDKRCHQFEKTNKNLQENIKTIKKFISEKGIEVSNLTSSVQLTHRRQLDVYSSHNLRAQNQISDISISIGSIAAQTSRRKSPNLVNPVLARMSNNNNNNSNNNNHNNINSIKNQQNNNNHINTFKKKSTFMEKRQNHNHHHH